jgi:uncharacterized membrane protein
VAVVGAVVVGAVVVETVVVGAVVGTVVGGLSVVVVASVTTPATPVSVDCVFARVFDEVSTDGAPTDGVRAGG